MIENAPQNPVDQDSPGTMDDGPTDQSVLSKLKDGFAASRTQRKDLLESWREAVAYRVQRPFSAGELTEDRIAVPEDWARTRQKVASLAFQVPKAILLPRAPQWEEVAPTLAAAANFKLQKETGAVYALDEALNDLVNASGIGVVIVRYEERSVVKKMPEQDISTLPPDVAASMLRDGSIKMVDVPEVVYRCYKTERVSPGSFLWPPEFTQSDWDKAPWLAYEDFISVAEAERDYKEKLGVDFKGTGAKPELLSEDVREGSTSHRLVDPGNSVRRTTCFYHADYYDPNAKPGQINICVYVDGIDEPVVHEPLNWQEYVEGSVDPKTGQKTLPTWVGVERNPIRVCTLGYVSDMAIPPSDSEAGRPQVRQMMRSQSQMFRQRDHSLPVRWYDTNRLDSSIADALRKGTWQDMIPVNGPGDRVIGEVAKATMPREDNGILQMTVAALDRSWALGNPQLGTDPDSGISATGLKQAQGATDIVLQYQKARVQTWWASIVEVLIGLMQRFQEDDEFVPVVGPDGIEKLKPWNRHTIPGKYIIDIVPDSGSHVDIAQKQDKALKMFNLIGKEPTVNRAELVKEIIQTHGYDPQKLSQKPAEPPKEQPNISYRFSGEDLRNPIAIALMIQSGIAITPDMIAGAKKLIEDANFVQEPQAPQPAPGQPTLPGLMDGQPEPEVPEMPQPIAKRATDGTHMV